VGSQRPWMLRRKKLGRRYKGEHERMKITQHGSTSENKRRSQGKDRNPSSHGETGEIGKFLRESAGKGTFGTLPGPVQTKKEANSK